MTKTLRAGRVTHFNSEKHFGFIAPNDGGPDVFLHVTNIIGEVQLRKGDEVVFEIGADQRCGRSRAVRVRRA